MDIGIPDLLTHPATYMIFTLAFGVYLSIFFVWSFLISPLVFLMTAVVARRRGVKVIRYAILGTVLFLFGVIPWVNMIWSSSNENAKRRLLTVAYVLLYVGWCGWLITFVFNLAFSPIVNDGTGVIYNPVALLEWTKFLIFLIAFVVSLGEVLGCQQEATYVRMLNRLSVRSLHADQSTPLIGHVIPYMIYIVWSIPLIPTAYQQSWTETAAEIFDGVKDFHWLYLIPITISIVWLIILVITWGKTKRLQK